MDSLDERIDNLTTKKNNLENKINQSNSTYEKIALECAQDRVNRDLNKANSKKFFEELVNGVKKPPEGILKFAR